MLFLIVVAFWLKLNSDFWINDNVPCVCYLHCTTVEHSHPGVKSDCGQKWNSSQVFYNVVSYCHLKIWSEINRCFSWNSVKYETKRQKFENSNFFYKFWKKQRRQKRKLHQMRIPTKLCNSCSNFISAVFVQILNLVVGLNIFEGKLWNFYDCSCSSFGTWRGSYESSLQSCIYKLVNSSLFWSHS